MSDVVRGSIIRWAGQTGTRVTNPAASFWDGLFPDDAFKKAIEQRGFTVVDMVNEWPTDDDHWYVVTAIVPAPGSVDGAGTWITQAAWETFGWVGQVATVDITGLPIAPEPDPVPTRVPLPGSPIPATNNQANNNLPKPDPCKDKTGLDWLACLLGFDKVATQWGFGAAAGATLTLATLAIIGLVILKK